MWLIDRHILVRFLANFVILFALLFVFAASIDLMLNLEQFVDEARSKAGEDAGRLAHAVSLLKMIVDFQGPRVFEFYGYLHGVLIIGAMGFTLAQMHRFKELVAVLASGVSMQRVAMPFVAGAFVICLVQLLNQEFILPRVAWMLLRTHDDIGRSSMNAFEIEFARYAPDELLHAPRFDPLAGALTSPTFIERDEAGATRRRIWAEHAVWDAARAGWSLEGGESMHFAASDGVAGDAVVIRETMDFHESDISPESLTVRRYVQFAGMLSLRQIGALLKSLESRDTDALRRQRYSRFALVLVNILVLVITLPTFLLREPANLMVQSLRCAALALPCLFGAVIAVMIPVANLPPAASVFLPVILLLPVALARVTFVRT